MPRAVFASLVLTLAATNLHAAVLIPARPYPKPGEPVIIKFLNENEQGKKALEKIGLAATQLDGMFTAAPATELVTANNPAFALYTFDGKKIEPKTADNAIKPDGTADLSLIFPQLKEAGTYILTWKDATPLVIETLRNPLPWSIIMDEARLPVMQRAAVIKQISNEEPVVTHIVPLQYISIKTDHGVIEAKFAYNVAPHTVDHFINLANQKFYDGTNFHRIISGFMIQGGDSLGNSETRAGTGGPGFQVGAEFSDKLHERGTLSMARSSSPDSAGSQFFIVHQKSTHLDGNYTAFGDVITGLNVVDEIAATPAEKSSGTVKGVKPKIESIRVLPATAEMYGLGKKPAEAPAK